jgi:methionyl-tRNA formyltransferase
MSNANGAASNPATQSNHERARGLQVVLFTNLTFVYQQAADWARRHGYTIKLVVTTPGPTTRRSTLYQGVIGVAPPEQDILITTRMKRLAAFLAPLQPDLIVSGSFPWRIPAEVTALPRFGAYNIHPAPLPQDRGPNGARRIYEGRSIGATLHRISPEFDAGEILFRDEVPLPDDATPENVFRLLGQVAGRVWEEGIARGLAGEPGEPQDESQATYAAAFTDEERALDWNRPRALLQRQTTALNFFGPNARARLGGEIVLVERLDPLSDPRPDVPIGTVVTRDGETAIVAVGDGIVRVRVHPLA